MNFNPFLTLLLVSAVFGSSVDHFNEMLDVAHTDSIKTFLQLTIKPEPDQIVLVCMAKKAVLKKRFDIFKILIEDYKVSLDSLLPPSPADGLQVGTLLELALALVEGAEEILEDLVKNHTRL